VGVGTAAGEVVSHVVAPDALQGGGAMPQRVVAVFFAAPVVQVAWGPKSIEETRVIVDDVLNERPETRVFGKSAAFV
jgi:hypothetical protein